MITVMVISNRFELAIIITITILLVSKNFYHITDNYMIWYYIYICNFYNNNSDGRNENNVDSNNIGNPNNTNNDNNNKHCLH